MQNAPITVHIVIECKLFILLDLPACKYAHPYMNSYTPLCHVAIGGTTVIQKASDAPSLGGINVLCIF